MLSSLPLQILLYFNGWWDVLYTVIMLVLFIWKDNRLPYHDELQDLLGLEIGLVFALGLLEYARILLGSRGNKTEQAGPLIGCLLLSCPAIVANVYYLHLQIYVTRADVIVNSISLIFIGLEVFLALLTSLSFLKARPASQ